LVYKVTIDLTLVYKLTIDLKLVYNLTIDLTLDYKLTIDLALVYKLTIDLTLVYKLTQVFEKKNSHLSYVKRFLWTSWGRNNIMLSNLQTMSNK
jgi:hypothetical protein